MCYESDEKVIFSLHGEISDPSKALFLLKATTPRFARRISGFFPRKTRDRKKTALACLPAGRMGAPEIS